MDRGRQRSWPRSGIDSEDRTRSYSRLRSKPFQKSSRAASPSPSSHQLPMLLQAILQCPACPPSSIISKPTTLLCGHTVCAEHVTSSPNVGLSSEHSLDNEKPATSRSVLPSCPILSCHTPAPGGPRYLRPQHPTSVDGTPEEVGVIYIPPPSSRVLRAPPPPEANVKVTQPRLDVTLARILAVLSQFPHIEAPSSRGSSVCSSGSESDPRPHIERRDTVKGVNRSKSRSSSASSTSIVRNIRRDVAKLQLRSQTSSPRRSSASPPHAREDHGLPATKRRRRGSTTSHTSILDDVGLSQNVSPDTPAPPPLPSALQAADSIPKLVPPGLDFAEGSIESPALEELREALLPELTCDVCYQLYYDPVTTPCQHVRPAHLTIESCFFAPSRTIATL